MDIRQQGDWIATTGLDENIHLYDAVNGQYVLQWLFFPKYSYHVLTFIFFLQTCPQNPLEEVRSGPFSIFVEGGRSGRPCVVEWLGSHNSIAFFGEEELCALL